MRRLRAAGCVFAEEEAGLLRAAAPNPAALDRLVSRRMAGEPLEYILGWVAFRGLRVAVAPGVFVPRHRTELVVSEALRLAPPGGTAVDLCCGCAAIGAALLAGGLTIFAADLDPAAVACARRNLPPDSVFLGDLFAALPDHLRGQVDVIAANVPYVPTDAIALMPPEARDHEPRLSLDGGPDGLDVLRRVAAGAPEWLSPGGHLLIEIADEQAPAAADAFAAAGLAPRIVTDPDIDATVLVGSLPADGARASHQAPSSPAPRG